MIETRSIWTDFIDGIGAELSEVFDQGQAEYLPGIGNLLTVTRGVGAQRRVSSVTGFGKVRQFDEGDNLPELRRARGYNTTITYNSYGGYVQVTKEALEDNEYRAIMEEMKGLGRSMNFAQDQSGAQIFNGGFATTADVNGFTMDWYGDGKPLFSTIHPTQVTGGSTQSNASSTSIPLTYDNLEVAYLALLAQKTDDGFPMAMGKPRLVVPPALLREALEMTGSSLDPTTGNNTINVFNGTMGFDVVMSLHLSAANGGSDTAWYVVVPGVTRLVHEVRQDSRMEKEVNILNKVATFTADARWTDAVLDWRHTWGSKGDATAYSG